MYRLTAQHPAEGFHSYGLRPDRLPTGHVLNVDHFHMSRPIFPPHPHAGFSAVTWMLPWSTGGFVNRDSLGGRERIRPGALHWTLAGAGVMHEEIPEGTDDCEGLQIFVKLPEPDELTAPRAFHLEPDQLAIAPLGSSTLRVLVGEAVGVRSSMPSHASTTLVHASVRDRVALDVPNGLDAFALVLRGAGSIGGTSVAAHDAGPIAAGALELAGDSLEVLLGWSAPMPKVPTFQGPFCMFDRDRLADAALRFRNGGMGALARSEAWS